MTLAVSALTGGCRDDPTYNGPADLETDTDIASDPVGDTDAEGDSSGGSVPPTKVCRTSPSDSTPGQTVLWLCDGYAQSVHDIDVDEAAMIQAVKDELGPISEAAVISKVEEFINGIDFQSDTQYDQFGPHYDEDAADKKQVVACCEDGYNYSNTVQPDDPDTVSEHGQACAIDCVDQTCRSVGYALKKLGDDAVNEVNVSLTKDVRDDFYALANFYSQHGFLDCVAGYEDVAVDPMFATYRVSKEGAFDVGQFLADARATCDDSDPGTACELPNLKFIDTAWILELTYDLDCDVGLTDTADNDFPGWHVTQETCDGLSVNDDFVFPWDQNPSGKLGFEISALEDAGPDIGLRYSGEGNLAVAPRLSAQVDGEDPMRYLPHLVGDGTLRVDWDRSQGEVGGVSWMFPTPPFDPTHLELSLVRIPDDCSSGSQPLSVDIYLEDDEGDIARAQAQNFTIASTSWPGNPSSCSNEELYTAQIPLSCFEASGGVFDPSIMTGLQLRFGDGSSTASGTVLIDSVELVTPTDTSGALNCNDLGAAPRVFLEPYACSDYAVQPFADYTPTSSSGPGDPLGELTLDGALGRFLAARPDAIAECDGTKYREDTAAGFDVRSLDTVPTDSLLDLLGLQDGDAAITINEPGKPTSNAVELYEGESFLVAIRRFGALEDLDVSFLREQSGGGYQPVLLGATIPADLTGVSAPERPTAPATYMLPGAATTVSTSADLVTELASPIGQDIILSDGTYNWTGPVTVAGPHRLWSETLHGAVVSFGLTYAGNADRTGGLELHGLSFALDDASMAPSGVGTTHVVYTWGQGGEDVLVEDCAFDGDLTVGNALGAFAANGLVVRRSTFENFWANAIFAKQGAAGTVLSSEPLLEDITIQSVFDTTPGSSSGVRENGILLGNNATVQRVDIRDVGWSGIQLYNDATGVIIRDVFIDYAGPGVWATSYTDPRGAGIWLSESNTITVERVRIESHSFIGVNLVWDGGNSDPFVNTTPPRNHDVLISDLYSRAYKIGVHMDFGVEDCSVRSSRFEHSWMAGVLDHNRFEDDWGWYTCAGGAEVCIETTNRVDNIDCYLEDGVDCVAHHHHGGASSTPPSGWASHPGDYAQPGGFWNRDDAASSASTSGSGGGGPTSGAVDTTSG